VKNWTLRQRILASFAVIIAIMLLMIVAAYSRLVAIETAEEAVGSDSIPGVYYSSMIRSAWVDSYVTSQQLVGLSNHREITSADMELFKSFDDRLKQHMASYQATIRTPPTRPASTTSPASRRAT
jgi:methyl-accepting chemotaxis protein WspA